MNDFKNIKQQILTDEKIANAVEYLMSKVILDKKLPQLKFYYKKHKIILGRNGLYSIYKPNGEKIANKIHFQEVAKYIIDNIDKYGLINHIQYIETEMFRHKERIEFFSSYNTRLNSDLIDCKIQSMYDSYYKYKNSLIQLLKQNNLYS